MADDKKLDQIYWRFLIKILLCSTVRNDGIVEMEARKHRLPTLSKSGGDADLSKIKCRKILL